MSNTPSDRPAPYCEAPEQDIMLDAWNEGKSLSSLISDRVNATPIDQNRIDDIEKRRRPLSNFGTDNLQHVFANVGVELGLSEYENDRRRAAEESLRREFLASKLIALAEWEMEDNGCIRQIPRGFWTGAEFRSSEDRVQRGTTKYIRVRITTPSQINHLHALISRGGDEIGWSDPGQLSDVSQEQRELRPASSADYPAPSGAKSYETKREWALLKLYKSYDDFEDMKFEIKLEKIVALVGADLARRGFGRTAVYDTIARLKEERRVPSDNVRNQKSADRTNT